MDPVRGALFRAGVLPEKTFDILISGGPICHPFPRRADREHPPAYFYRSNSDLDNDSLAPGTGGWYRSIKISYSYDRGVGGFKYKLPVC